MINFSVLKQLQGVQRLEYAFYQAFIYCSKLTQPFAMWWQYSIFELTLLSSYLISSLQQYFHQAMYQVSLSEKSSRLTCEEYRLNLFLCHLHCLNSNERLNFAQSLNSTFERPYFTSYCTQQQTQRYPHLSEENDFQELPLQVPLPRQKGLLHNLCCLRLARKSSNTTIKIRNSITIQITRL